jgi:rRNA maturation endonuclease Nob1
MSSSETVVDQPARRDVQGIYDQLREAVRAEADVSRLSDADLQRLMAVASKELALRHERGERTTPFAPEHVDTLITATDAAVISSAILDALSVEVFELGLWKTWGTT